MLKMHTKGVGWEIIYLDLILGINSGQRKWAKMEIDKNQKEDIKKAFELFDSDGKGTIDRS